MTGKFNLRKFYLGKLHRENSTIRKFHLRKIPPVDNSTYGQFYPWTIPPMNNSIYGKFHPWTIPPMENSTISFFFLATLRLLIFYHNSIICFIWRGIDCVLSYRITIYQSQFIKKSYWITSDLMEGIIIRVWTSFCLHLHFTGMLYITMYW